MADSAEAAAAPLSLEQLRALTAEMAALSRAGVPLHEGLRHLGEDLPRRLGRIAADLSGRLERGQPLDQALGPEHGIPPAFSALLAVGVRTGRLTHVLEGVSSLLMRAADTRWMIFAALLYPLVLGGIALQLFAFLLAKPMPVMLAACREVAPESLAWRPAEWLARTSGYWGPGIPLLVLAAVGLWWWRSGRAGVWERGRGRAAWRPAGRSFRNMLRRARRAVFADSLALLIEHEIPLDEALKLAADSSGDGALKDAAGEMSARLRRGESAGEAAVAAGMPPLLACLYQCPGPSSRTVAALRRMAESCRQDADAIYRWLTRYVPIGLIAGLGGVTVAVYAVTVFWPWADFLRVVSRP